jgi:hypothetical protein
MISKANCHFDENYPMKLKVKYNFAYKVDNTEGWHKPGLKRAVSKNVISEEY